MPGGIETPRAEGCREGVLVESPVPELVVDLNGPVTTSPREQVLWRCMLLWHRGDAVGICGGGLPGHVLVDILRRV